MKLNNNKISLFSNNNNNNSMDIQNMLRQSSTTKKRQQFSGKMTNIIRKEMLSESDDDDFNEHNANFKLKRSTKELNDNQESKRLKLSVIEQDLNNIMGKHKVEPRNLKMLEEQYLQSDINLDDLGVNIMLGESSISLNGSNNDLSVTSNNDLNESITNLDPLYIHEEYQEEEDEAEDDVNNKKYKNKGPVKVLSLNADSTYYKQFYRKAWENQPEFKGWLAPCENQPQKAKCIYCNSILSAHSFSLLKHVASAKHQRNAEKIYLINSDLYETTYTGSSSDIGNVIEESDEDSQDINNIDQSMMTPSDCYNDETALFNINNSLKNAELNIHIEGSSSTNQTTHQYNNSQSEDPTNSNVINVLNLVPVETYGEDSNKVKNIIVLNDFGELTTEIAEDEYEEEDEQDVDDPDEIQSDDMIKVIRLTEPNCLLNQNKNEPKTELSSTSSSYQPITTHVIDSNLGLPISNLLITLYKLIDGRWQFISEKITNPGGRALDFIKDFNKFSCGRYKLHYHVYKYFEMKRIGSVFPFIEVAFDVKSLNNPLHFPLVISGNGYNIYKG